MRSGVEGRQRVGGNQEMRYWLMAGKRLNGLDIAFLRLDTPAAPMNIGTLAVFEPARPIALADLVGLLTERLGSVDRFRQRLHTPVFPPGEMEWVDDDRFQVEAHVRVNF